MRAMKAFVVLCVVALAGAKPMAKEDGLDKFMSALRDCMDGESMLCLKEKAMKYSENLAVSKDLSLVDGVSFARTGGSPRSARSYEPLAEEPKARELQIEERIMDNVVDFLDSHALQLRMPKAFVEDNTVEEEGRGKKKKKLKKLLPILALIKLKLSALVPLFLGIIAFAVFKAYLLGKVAFIAAAIGILKKLLESKKSGGGWEQPAHEEHHGGGWESSGGWGRSQEANNLAYSAHAKQA